MRAAAVHRGGLLSRARTALRRVGLAALALLGLLLVAGLSALLWLQSEAGGRFLKDRALAALQGALDGKLGAGALRLQGQLLVLDDVVLRTPEGEVVARLKHLTARVELAALARSTVHLRTVELTGLEADLVQEARGWNVARALSKELPAVASSPASPLAWSVVVDALTLREGTVSVSQGESREAPTRAFTVSGLTLEGKGLKLELGAQSYGGSVALDGTFRERATREGPGPPPSRDFATPGTPLEAPLALVASGTWRAKGVAAASGSPASAGSAGGAPAGGASAGATSASAASAGGASAGAASASAAPASAGSASAGSASAGSASAGSASAGSAGPAPAPRATLPDPGARSDGALHARLTLGAAVVEASFNPAGDRLEVEEVQLPPELLRVLVAGWPLRVPLTATGALSTTQADLALTAGSGKATLRAAYALATPSISDFALEVQGADLAQLFPGGRPSRLSLSASGALRDLRPDSLEGEAHVRGAWVTPSGLKLATVQGDATAKAGRFSVSNLAVIAPGAQLDLDGSGTLAAASLTGTLRAKNLEQLAKAIAELTQAPPLPLTGEGQLSLRVSGPLRHPLVSAKGSFPTIGYGATVARGVTLEATVPDVLRPFDVDGTLSIATLRVGGSELRELSATVATRGRDFEAWLLTKGRVETQVHAKGLLEKGGKGVNLSELTLGQGEGRWSLAQSVDVEVSSQRLAVEGLKLVSGAQQLDFSGAKEGARVRAQLSARALELSALPGWLAPRDWGLRGAVALEASAGGTVEDLTGAAKLTLEGGGFRDVRGVSGTVDLTWRDGRAAGSYRLAAPMGSLRGTLEVPVLALRRKQPLPLAVDATLERVDLYALAAALRTQWPVQAVVTGTVKLSGTAVEPRAALQLDARSGVALLPTDGSSEPRAVPFDRLLLGVTSQEDGRLMGTVQLTALGGVSDLILDTPYTLGQLLAQVPTVEEALRTPLQARLTSDGTELKALRELGLLGELEPTGRVGVSLSFRGSAEAPAGDGELRLLGFTLPGLLPVDVRLGVKATREDTSFDGAVTRGARSLGTLSGNLTTSIESLGSPEVFQTRPLRFEVGVGPLALSEVYAPVRDDEEPPPRGQVSLRLSLDGTLERPLAKLIGNLEKLEFGAVSLGRATFGAQYAQGLTRATAVMTSEGGGTLEAKGSLTLGLSLPALRAGLDWKAAPVTATLSSSRFDVAFLSGVVPTVRVIGGLLTAQAQLSGTAASPAFSGRASWEQGRLGLLGFGEYRDIALAVQGDNAHLTLEKLFARSGGGSANLTGAATRADARVWSFKLSGQTEEFPLVLDDQLRAILTLALSLEGRAQPGLVQVTRLAFPRVTVKLPEVKSKDLQSLERPKDIVVVREGRAVVGTPLLHTLAARPGARKKAPVEGAAPQVATRYEVNIVAPFDGQAAQGPIWVKSGDLNINLSLSDPFRLEYQDTLSLQGEATVVRGSIDVIGRRFEVARDSRVRFQGSATEPYVSVTAEHRNDREGVSVFVSVVGRGKATVPKLTSQPALSESEILILLATGRRTLKSGSGATITGAQAASVVGGFAASKLKELIGAKAPVDVINIEAGDEGFAGTRGEVGKYLGDTVYLGYQFRIGADARKGENTHTGRLEWQVAKRVTLEVSAGDALNAGADALWSRDF